MSYMSSRAGQLRQRYHYYPEELPAMDTENGPSTDKERPQAPVFTPEQQRWTKQMLLVLLYADFMRDTIETAHCVVGIFGKYLFKYYSNDSVSAYCAAFL